MPRRMSFALTEAQFLDGSKDVTRRLGWRSLKPGQQLTAVRKCMGLKRGEVQVVIGELVVVSVHREPLGIITADECRREGFPQLTPEAFVELFCTANNCGRTTIVNRIEFRKTTATKDSSSHGRQNETLRAGYESARRAE
jgi:hypothetical protein